MLAKHKDRAALILERFERSNVDRIVAAVPEYRRSSFYPQQEATIYRVIQTSYELLEPREKDLLARFAIFPEDTFIPIGAVELLGSVTGLDALDFDQSLEDLSDAALLTYTRDDSSPARSGISLHDIQRDFVRRLGGDARANHAAVVQAFCARHNGRLYAAEDEGGSDYLRRFMVHHLIGAGMAEDLFELLIDPHWIGHRLNAKDPVLELVGDYDRALVTDWGA